ncbi:putative transcriptional regulator, GntR family protein [Mesorhizobium metallidurans STM 2683]|uniref:Putative transcriptional regulator, GntR family protein n=1 Tax=Mesorhizobium metallidurans STM 2683 TaxID=1297569 RepID=M5EYD8_9HYPH|nr:FCD domain-containing protein [Mesorhizobium metallidurans]CCV09197.1 putative transcriptional regulator, GntR family protein [Mesorhizobium metallidurans STM 2683]
MDDAGNGGQAALVQLQAYLAQMDHSGETRLPAERELCESLGVSRGDLRKALAVLEKDGRIWRHVGRGTFVGRGPVEETIGISEIAGRTNPADVMRARLIIEPEIAREAALHATLSDIAAMRQSLVQTREAVTWRQYENIDNLLHRQIAQASRNNVLLGLFDVLNAVRRTVVWGRLRAEGARPPADHHSFADHERIVEAIADRDLGGAAAAMRLHLQQVERRLIPVREAAE